MVDAPFPKDPSCRRRTHRQSVVFLFSKLTCTSRRGWDRLCSFRSFVGQDSLLKNRSTRSSLEVFFQLSRFLFCSYCNVCDHLKWTVMLRGLNVPTVVLRQSSLQIVRRSNIGEFFGQAFQNIDEPLWYHIFHDIRSNGSLQNEVPTFSGGT